MTWLSNERIPELLQKLEEMYPNPLPPLQHRNAFELLIAVILSAQCTDARVNQITPNLFPKDRPCEPKDILKLSEEEVLNRIHSCTYYQAKTRFVIGTAQKIAEWGEVPNDFEKLRSLPGVGAKTAQVVLSQWFHQDAFPVDTHVHRVSNRLGLADSGKNREKTERQVKERVPKENWSKLHLQLIYHGRATCHARRPHCEVCPLNQICPSSVFFLTTKSPKREGE